MPLQTDKTPARHGGRGPDDAAGSREFNLLDSPWIRALTERGATETVSIRGALENAHRYASLAGETQAQDAAILRLLLAVLHSVAARGGFGGRPRNSDEAKSLWQLLWEGGRLPMAAINGYLDEYHDRFWLFDKDRPFYQANVAACGSQFGAERLNGAILESNNKVKMFAGKSWEERRALSYAEAARWLVYLQGYADAASPKEPKVDGLRRAGERVSASKGWLGQIGLIYAEGNSLFETLLLNLCLLKDGAEPWPEATAEEGQCAAWELPEPKTWCYDAAPVPETPQALYTLQAWRVLLEREQGKVHGFRAIVGDVFANAECFTEQMTVWMSPKNGGKGNIPLLAPRRHQAAVKLWREFGAIANARDQGRAPGLVKWLSLLMRKGDGVLPADAPVRLRAVGVEYDANSTVVLDSFSDSLSFHAGLLQEHGQAWRAAIEQEVRDCEALCSRALGALSRELALAAGRDKGQIPYASAFYSRVDPVFRRWLLGVEEKGDIQESTDALRKEICGIAVRLSEEMVSAVGGIALRGRAYTDKKGKVRRYSAPKAHAAFLRMARLYKCHGQSQEDTKCEKTT